MARRVSNTVFDEGRRLGATRRELLAAGVTGITESHFRNLPGGDGTSVGWRQETASSYPGVNRRNVRAGARRFFREARSFRGQKMSVGELAQAVQRSAYPERYQTHLSQAKALLRGAGPTTAPAGGGNPHSSIVVPDTREALSAALISGASDPLLEAQRLLATGQYTRHTTLPDTHSRFQGGANHGPVTRGHVTLSAGADRSGVRTKQAVIDFDERIAGVYGHALTIGTGTQHNRMTTSGNVSDHWTGNASDIPSSGAALTRLGQSALIASGKSPAWARKQHGGLFNVMYHGHRVQIIFNSNIGGDHFTHLHVGIR